MAADIEIRMVLCVPVPWSQLSAGIKPSTEWSTDLAALDLRLGFPPQHSPERWTQSQGTELWLCLLFRAGFAVNSPILLSPCSLHRALRCQPFSE